MTELKSFDRVAHVYDETRGLPPEAERAIADGIAAEFRSATRETRIVEVGVGTGRIAVPLTERGLRVTGIDISTKMLGVLLEKRRDIDVILAEASRPPLRERAFDGALFVHILHLVPDADATVRAAIKLVRAGGALIEARDDHRSSVRDKADTIIRETVQQISGVDIGGWSPYERGSTRFTELLREAGAEVRHVPLAEWTGTTRGRRMLERLARRDYSSSWKIPEKIMPELLERVTPMLDDLYGGLDREISFDRSVSMTVGRLPA
ncbi:MAG TPA: class I SAM-dependent methyltransferase [Dehalococcoidia bacterium]